MDILLFPEQIRNRKGSNRHEIIRILSVIEGSDRIRIIEGKRGNREPQFDPGVKILYSGYASMVAYHSDTDAYLERDPEVRRVVASPEIRHKEFKERGLFPPCNRRR